MLFDKLFRLTHLAIFNKSAIKRFSEVHGYEIIYKFKNQLKTDINYSIPAVLISHDVAGPEMLISEKEIEYIKSTEQLLEEIHTRIKNHLDQE